MQVTVQVTDTGPGIAPWVRERLFQPFVTSKGDGSGLGLSICKRLIEAHGGTIEGRNGPDGGATFRFGLPVQPEPVAVEILPQAPSQAMEIANAQGTDLCRRS